MTLRALLLGLLGAAVICGFSYYNDVVLRQTGLVNHHMPFSVFAVLILYLLLARPLLARGRGRLALGGREMAVVLALLLAACSVPGAGLLRYFTTSTMLPHYYDRIETGWRTSGVLELLPGRMLPDISQNEAVALNGFIRGMSAGSDHIAVTDVPWSAWWRTLGFWLPLVGALWLALLGLAVVLHRQWSDHEQLPYPVAQFAHALLPDGAGAPPLLRQRLFWLGAAPVLLLYLNNYASCWFPDQLIAIPTFVDLAPLFAAWETFMRGPYYSLIDPQLFLAVVGLAYFLPTEVSFSVGLGPYLYAVFGGVLFGYGVTLRAGGLQSPHLESFLFLGAFTGVMLMLLYTGRHFYGRVFRRALWPAGGNARDAGPVWGARIFLIGAGAFIANLVLVGLDWQLAVLYTAMLLMVFVVMGRIIAETGLFFLAPRLYPGALLLGLLGGQALGPRMAAIMMVVSMVFVLDPREVLMPFLVNGLKIADMKHVPTGRVALGAGLALVVGLAVGLPVTLYIQYDRGCPMADRWATRRSPQSPFLQVMHMQQRLAAQSADGAADAVAAREADAAPSGWRRLARMQPRPIGVVGFTVSFALVIGLSLARLRFARWPLHPVLLLVWNTYPARIFAASFLIGSLVKYAVTRYGGAGVYQRLKPLMLGLIAGELLGDAIPMLIGLLYHLFTGEPPRSFSVFL